MCLLTIAPCRVILKHRNGKALSVHLSSLLVLISQCVISSPGEAVICDSNQSRKIKHMLHKALLRPQSSPTPTSIAGSIKI